MSAERLRATLRSDVRSQRFRHDTAFVSAVVDQPARSEGASAEILIELRGVTIRVPDEVSADHIERVLLAVQVAM